jgi:hypothetical protein
MPAGADLTTLTDRVIEKSCAGRPLSRDRKLIPGADAFCVAEGNMSRNAPTRFGPMWFAIPSS